ncbi:MAG TPA: hypothetical protein DCM62_07415, partial [Bacteroidales bacterium]|nr:hypothetical protein [Bacteroidales bacterium]
LVFLSVLSVFTLRSLRFYPAFNKILKRKERKAFRKVRYWFFLAFFAVSPCVLCGKKSFKSFKIDHDIKTRKNAIRRCLSFCESP